MEQVVRIHASREPQVNRQLSVIRKTILITGQYCSAFFACGRGLAQRQNSVAYGYGLFTGGLGAHYGAERWALR